MSKPQPPRPAAVVPEAGIAVRYGALVPLLIVNVGVLVYGNSLAGDFVFDDEHDIVENERIQNLWTSWLPTGDVWRPVTVFSFAVNAALSKDALGFHAVNALIHILAALTLYGIVRRTLLLDQVAKRHTVTPQAATWLALAVALLWLVHPLQTEAVTYVVHRYESLMGLFYLLTLYCVLRGATAIAHPRLWYLAAVVNCALGMGSKEVMVTAPVMVLLYDRIFLSPSWRELLRRRWPVYAGLAVTWGMLWMQVLAAFFPTERWAGFGMKQRTVFEYASSQPRSIMHYLKLSFWPTDLCIDYGWLAPRPWHEIVLPGLAILAMLVATVWALWRRPALGFLGVWFFLILAPTSSVMPIADLAAERRMYLSLAAVIVAVVLAGHWLLDALGRSLSLAPWARALAAGLAVVVPVAALSVLTFQRNQDYYSKEDIWRDVIAKRPENTRGHHNLAAVLMKRGRFEAAVEQLEIAAQCPNPAPNTFRSLGFARERQGLDAEAIAYYEYAVRRDPKDGEGHRLLGGMYARQGNLPKALEHLSSAVEIKPLDAAVHKDLGGALWQQGKVEAAREHYHTAIRLRPDFAAPYDSLGALLWMQGKDAEAEENFVKAVQLDPMLPEAQNHLGMVFSKRNELAKATDCFALAVRLKRDDVTFRCNLADALWRQGKTSAARAEYRQSIVFNPGWPEATNKTARRLATDPDPQHRDGPRSVQMATQVCRAAEDKNPEYLDTLAAAYAETGDFAKAITTAAKALELAVSARQTELAGQIDQRLQLYRAGKPYRAESK